MKKKKRNKNLVNLLEYLADPKESKLLIAPNRKGKKRTSANLDEMICILIEEVLRETENRRTLPRGGAGAPVRPPATSGGYNPIDKFNELDKKFNEFKNHFDKIFKDETSQNKTLKIITTSKNLDKTNLKKMVEVLKEIKDLFISIIEPPLNIDVDKNPQDIHDEKNKQIIAKFQNLYKEKKFENFNFVINNAEKIFLATSSTSEEAEQLSKEAKQLRKTTARMSNYLERIESKKFIEPIKLGIEFQNKIDTLQDILKQYRVPYLNKSQSDSFRKKLNDLRLLSKPGDTEDMKKREFIEILNNIKALQPTPSPQKSQEPYVAPQNVMSASPGILGKIGSGVSGALGRFKQLFTEYKDIPDEVLLEMFKRANISEQMLIEITGCKRYSLKEAMEKDYD